MGSLGTTELLVILAIVLLVFGASKLPALGRGMGQSIREFRTSLAGEDEKQTNKGTAE